MSPEVTSSRPAIMRSVVLLPQPEGPTSTTNSLFGMSRSMARTASTSSKRLTTDRSATSAIRSPLRGAGREARDVVVHQERVDHQRRGGGGQRAPPPPAPLVHRGAGQPPPPAAAGHPPVAG